MNLFDGLHLYEVVLLILGSTLFLVLVAVLIISVAKNRSIKPLLLFFVVPILMIGFPAVTKVKFDKDGVEIDKATKELAENPSNPALKSKLETLIQETKPRLDETRGGPVKIARAEAVLGDREKALQTLNHALQTNPQLEVAKDLRSRLETVPPSNAAAARRAVTANIAIAPGEAR